MSWDTIVVGSGPGGLTAAVALARSGQRVLVLEQHYLPGGWTHSFSLSGYRFSPGVHYIGDMDHGGSVRRLYEGLGLTNDLEFCELNPDGFDHLLIAGERFDQPKGFQRWKDRLRARFPREHDGLERYFKVLADVTRDVRRCDTILSFPEVLALPFRAPALLRWGFRTLGALLDGCIRDPMLRAVLASRAGNIGLAPSRVSLPVHAVMEAHYHDGGFYPRGGARSIPRAYIKELRRRGGEIRVKARVGRILVEGGRAAGVELDGGERIDAKSVVCNADPAVVFGKLLAPEHCKKEMLKVKRTEYSSGLLSMFCAVDMDLEKLGYDSGNYWWYRSTDVDGAYRRTEHALPAAELETLFLTITTLKDPGPQKSGHHTLEMFAFLPYAQFERWSGSHGVRPEGYAALKRLLGDKMLDAAEQIIPGMRRHLRFSEVGTPLTNDFFCGTHRGASYGTAKTPWQVGPFSFKQRSPIRGLHFCGSSTISHGVAAASMSGLIAAQHVLGRSSPEDLLSRPDGSLRIYPADRPQEWLPRREAPARELDVPA